MESLFTAAQGCIAVCDPQAKVRATQQAALAWREARLGLNDAAAPLSIGEPGRPERPQLVEPKYLRKRGLGSPQGHAALVHALAHIEFNAINLAWDAVYRFRGMPRDYYGDWLRVADEEAYHFRLLCLRLGELGYAYGDFPAHHGLWEAAQKTAHDVLLRMALVPRVLEARGLDVTPGIMTRLRGIGDEATVALLEIILRDEVGHVEIGTRWFHHVCDERGLDREATFRALMEQYMRGRIKGPLHRDARLQAGFSVEELDYLEGML